MKNIRKNSVVSTFKIFIFIAGVLIALACSSDEDITTPANESSYDITAILSKFEGTGLNYAVNGNTVTFTTQNLPNHSSPYWPVTSDMHDDYNGSNSNWHQNPNIISEQNFTFTITLNPSEASNHEPTNLGPIGISRNGIVFFNQYAGPNQPLTNEINSFDQWLGHPQQQGAYHYHIEPTYLTSTFGEDVFLGLLADGFPVYGPVENGSVITNDDLDIFHGHVSPTPDFPEGIYHYHITGEDPYINGNGYFGSPGNISG